MEKYNLIFWMQIQLAGTENISVACCLSTKKVVRRLKMSNAKCKSLETLCTDLLMQDGELFGLLPSPTPFLPPILRENVQQVLVESPG